MIRPMVLLLVLLIAASGWWAFRPASGPPPTPIRIADLGVELDPGKRPRDEAAESLLSRMLEKYAQLTVYCDEGRVVTLMAMFSGDGWVRTRPFHTRFVRPDRFRYEFRDSQHPRLRSNDEDVYVVWQNGEKAQSWWSLHTRTGSAQATQTFDALGPALAGPTGVSGGSAVLIASILMPEQVTLANGLAHLHAPRIVGEEPIGGVACIKIEAIPTGEPAAPMTIRPGESTATLGPVWVWIGKEDLLVRQVRTVTEFTDFTSDDITTITPRLAPTPGPIEFEFSPPETGAPAAVK